MGVLAVDILVAVVLQVVGGAPGQVVVDNGAPLVAVLPLGLSCVACAAAAAKLVRRQG